jgi:hypothetical protein
MPVHTFIHMNILSRIGVRDYRRSTGWILGLLTTCTQHTQLQLSIALSISTHFTVHRYTHTNLDSQSSLVISWQRIYKFRCNFSTHLFSTIFDCRLKRLPQFFYQLDWDLRYIASGRPPKETQFTYYISIVIEVCLLRHCIKTSVLLLLRACLPIRYVATDYSGFRRHISIYRLKRSST